MQVQLRFRHRMLVRGRGGNHREQRPVDAIGARRQDTELATLLAAVQQELARVLKVVAIDHFAQDALGWDRRAVRRQHQRNLALRHDGDGRLDDPVLPAVITEVQSRSQCVRLVAGLAVQRHQSARRQRPPAELLDHDAHLALVD